MGLTFSRRGLLAGSAAAGFLPASAIALTPSNDGLVAETAAWARDAAFNGMAATGKGGVSTAFSARGWADISSATAFNRSTPMAIASISKRLTTVAVLRLVELGDLDLGAPITRYLPGYRSDTGNRVTLRGLLSNSSGVQNRFAEVLRADPTALERPLTTNEAIALFASGDLVFAEGERFDYALTNWILVQGILESVTGKPFAELMSDLVLSPLGLTSTRLDFVGGSESYRSLEPLVVWASPQPAYLSASGGYYSTIDDLLRFAEGVYSTDFLSTDSRTALTTVLLPDAGYALGGRVRSVLLDGQEVRCAWETGSRNGYRSVLGHRLDGRGAAVVLNNTGLQQRALDGFAERVLALAGHA